MTDNETANEAAGEEQMRTLVAVVGFAVVTALAGCTTPVQIAGSTYDCRTTNSFKVVHAHSELRVIPDCVQAPPGSTITLRFANEIAAGKARSKLKAGGPMWLNGENSHGRPQEITITIDPSEQHGAAYAFILEVDDYGTLDPRIVVQ